MPNEAAMSAKFRDAKFDEDTAKVIPSVGGQPVEPQKTSRTSREKTDGAAPKAKETAAAARILRDHARRGTGRRAALGR